MRLYAESLNLKAFQSLKCYKESELAKRKNTTRRNRTNNKFHINGTLALTQKTQLITSIGQTQTKKLLNTY